MRLPCTRQLITWRDRDADQMRSQVGVVPAVVADDPDSAENHDRQRGRYAARIQPPEGGERGGDRQDDQVHQDQRYQADERHHRAIAVEGEAVDAVQQHDVDRQ